MDIIFEVGIAALARLIAHRISQERVVFGYRGTVGDETFVFHDAEVGGLTVRVPRRTPRPWNRPAGRGMAPDAAWIPAPDVEGRQAVTIHVASLSALRAHRPSDPLPVPTIPLTVTIIFDIRLRIDGGVSFALEIRDVELPELGTEEENAAARAQVLERLRSATSGIESALDLSQAATLLGTVPAVLNAGLTVDEVNGTATFLQVGIQFEPVSATISDLEAARVAEETAEMLRAFYATPASRRNMSDWTLWLSAGLLEKGALHRTDAVLTRHAGSLRVRDTAVARWHPPRLHPPVGRVFVQVPVTVLNACGTDHHLRVRIDASITISVSADNQLQIDIHLDDERDALDVTGCALEIGALFAAGGFVIGGTFAGWIGAAIGAAIGFVGGFFTALTVALTYWPELGRYDTGCSRGATARDIRCLQPFGFGAGLLSGLTVRTTVGFDDGLALAGMVNVPARGVAPRVEVVIGQQLRWGRLPGTRSWGLIGQIHVHNEGGGRAYLGDVTAIGAGAELWNGRFTRPTHPISAPDRATVTLFVPREAVEAARAAGTLHAPEVLVYTTAGTRLVRFRSIPDPVSDEELQQAEYLEEFAGRIRGMIISGLFLGQPFPGPGPREGVLSLVQLRVRDGLPGQRVAIISEEGQIVASAIVDQNGSAAIDAFTPAKAGRMVLMHADGSKPLSWLENNVPMMLDSARDMLAKRTFELRKMFAHAIVEGAPDHAVAVSIAGLFDVDARKVDLGGMARRLEEMEKETEQWPGTITTRRTTAIVSTLLSTTTPLLGVQERVVNGRKLVDLIGRDVVRTIDVSRLEVPVLAGVRSTRAASGAAAQADSWWQAMGLVRSGDRLIGLASQIAPGSGRREVVALSIAET